MPRYVLVLEDNADRRDAMRAALAARLLDCELRLTDDPDEFITFVRTLGPEVVAASLDHDLYERPDESTTLTGMLVVEHFVTIPPTFPVLLHTSNRPDGERMRARLREAGWRVKWVTPFADTAWVRADWLPTLKRAIRRKPPAHPET